MTSTPSATRSPLQTKTKCSTCTNNKSCNSLNCKATPFKFNFTPKPAMASMAAAASSAAKAKAPLRALSSWQRVARVFREAHPVGRVPKYLQAHELPGAAYYFKRLGRASSMFVPIMVGFFGWPFFTMYLINKNNGVYDSKKPRKAAASRKMSRKSSIDSEAWRQKTPA